MIRFFRQMSQDLPLIAKGTGKQLHQLQYLATRDPSKSINK
jgi:hypothetical protein